MGLSLRTNAKRALWTPKSGGGALFRYQIHENLEIILR